MYLASNYTGRQTPESARHPPTYNFHVKPGTYYTLIMLDYDAPRPNSPWLHLLYINITDPRNIKPANIITSCCLWPKARSSAFSGGSAPSPPHRTGKHTYITYLFEQRHPIYGQNTIGDWGRPHFDVEGFMAKYGLKTVASTEFYVDSGAGGARHRRTRRIITRRKTKKRRGGA